MYDMYLYAMPLHPFLNKRLKRNINQANIGMLSNLSKILSLISDISNKNCIQSLTLDNFC